MAGTKLLQITMVIGLVSCGKLAFPSEEDNSMFSVPVESTSLACIVAGELIKSWSVLIKSETLSIKSKVK